MRGTARVQRATVEITFVRGRRAPRVGTKGRLVEPVKERHVDFHLESSSACTWNHHHDQLGSSKFSNLISISPVSSPGTLHGVGVNCRRLYRRALYSNSLYQPVQKLKAKRFTKACFCHLARQLPGGGSPAYDGSSAQSSAA